MGRAKGEGQVTKMRDGTWRVRITHQGRTLSAKRRTRREAVDQLAVLRHRLGLADSGGTTVADWMEMWLASRDLAPNSLRLYTRMVRVHIAPRLGRMLLVDLDTPTVQRTYRAMQDDGVGTATIGRVHSVLSVALGAAAREGYLRDVPTVHAQPPAHTPKRPQPITPDQAREVLAACRTPDAPSGRIIATILLMGLRASEAINLRWEHVDRDGMWLSVPGTKTTGSAAVLPLPPIVLDVMGDPTRPVWPVFHSAGHPDTKTSRQTVHRHWANLCTSLGIVPARRIHDLRHSTGSLLASAGVPTRVIQSVLRHTSAAMSVHYSRPHDPALRDALDSLGDGLS